MWKICGYKFIRGLIELNVFIDVFTIHAHLTVLHGDMLLYSTLENGHIDAMMCARKGFYTVCFLHDMNIFDKEDYLKYANMFLPFVDLVKEEKEK